MIHDNGDWLADYDQDVIGIVVGAHANNLWAVDNEMYHNSGNGVQTNAGFASLQDTTHHIYIGRNTSHHNKQSGLFTKYATDVIISQNTSYACRPVYPNPSSPGEGIGASYGPENIWILFNKIYDCEYGVRFSTAVGPGSNIGSGEDIYIIGNLITDIHYSKFDVTGQYEQEYSSLDPWGRGKGIAIWHETATKHIISNTIYDADGGIYITRTYNPPAPVIIVNNIIAGIGDNESSWRHVRIERDEVAAVSKVYNNLFGQTPRVQFGEDAVTIGITALETIYADNAWNNLEGDPQFVSPMGIEDGGRGFQLLAGSPAIDAGLGYEAIQTFQDLYGIDISVGFDAGSRPQGSAWDIGAFEYIDN